MLKAAQYKVKLVKAVCLLLFGLSCEKAREAITLYSPVHVYEADDVMI